jgi:hypothetical protein
LASCVLTNHAKHMPNRFVHGAARKELLTCTGRSPWDLYPRNNIRDCKAPVADMGVFACWPLRCHLDKECFCKEDIHCGKGHACVPAKSFPEYKVCKPDYAAAGVRRQTRAPTPNPLLPLPTLLGH